ncbi:hypothetical protein AOQ84DRAFT_432903 [Glonium stellatum]|uniref:TMEM205-like domain-containing protein n=1 Tax=Glonium stellatum TaxID=574774 RepID=A0A8E2JQM0_9PEZI|nr:hypothetical protein AOQ84DRAFT_432903 [Glonium stellatum]
MTTLSALTNPASYHLLSYGTLLGSTLFQSFIGGIIAFRVLPRPQFSVLQQHTFPTYFTLQSIAPVVLALTYPGGRGGFTAIYEGEGNKLVIGLFATMFVTAVANWVWLGPATTRCMQERKHQETRDGKKPYDAGPHSVEMERLNKKFSALHGASSLLNLCTFIAVVWYGFVLGERV